MFFIQLYSTALQERWTISVPFDSRMQWRGLLVVWWKAVLRLLLYSFKSCAFVLLLLLWLMVTLERHRRARIVSAMGVGVAGVLIALAFSSYRLGALPEWVLIALSLSAVLIGMRGAQTD